MRLRVIRIERVLALAAVSVALSASQAIGAVPLGQVAPDGNTATCSGVSDSDVLQRSIVSGTSYVVPGVGSITSWSTNARAGAGQLFGVKVFRHVGGAAYSVVGHDGPRPLTPSVVNTFATSIAVQPGDILGITRFGASTTTGCFFGGDPGDLRLSRSGNLADGGIGDFEPAPFDSRLNIAATFVPSNSFSFGAIRRNKRKGTATLTVNLPNSGELSLSGKGVKTAAARHSRSVPAGPARLIVRAKGKRKRTLNAAGKVKIKPKVTFTPAGGDPSTRARSVKLKKRR